MTSQHPKDEPINLVGDQFDTLASCLMDDMGVERHLPGHVAANAHDTLAKVLRCLISERHADGLLQSRTVVDVNKARPVAAPDQEGRPHIEKFYCCPKCSCFFDEHGELIPSPLHPSPQEPQADVEAVVERLRSKAEAIVRGFPPEQTDEWQAADLITALSKERDRLGAQVDRFADMLIYTARALKQENERLTKALKQIKAYTGEDGEPGNDPAIGKTARAALHPSEGA